MWCQSVQSFDSFPKHFNLWPPKKTPKCPGVLYLAFVHSQTNPPTCTKFGAAVWQLPQTFECVTLYPPPQMPPGVLRGDLDLAYVHSQMNPQTWTKVDANRSSRLTASPDFWMLTPKTPQVPPLCPEGQFVWRISIPRLICRCVPNLVPIGPAVWQLPRLSNVWHLPPPPPEMPPGLLRGDLYLAYVHSQMNPQT